MTTYMPYIESKPETFEVRKYLVRVAAGNFESGILTECDCWWQDTEYIFKKQFSIGSVFSNALPQTTIAERALD